MPAAPPAPLHQGKAQATPVPSLSPTSKQEQARKAGTGGGIGRARRIGIVILRNRSNPGLRGLDQRMDQRTGSTNERTNEQPRGKEGSVKKGKERKKKGKQGKQNCHSIISTYFLSCFRFVELNRTWSDTGSIRQSRHSPQPTAGDAGGRALFSPISRYLLSLRSSSRAR